MRVCVCCRGCGGGGGGAARRAGGRAGAAHSDEQLSTQSGAGCGSVRVSLDNTNTCCTDSLVTALDDETLLLGDADMATPATKNHGGSTGKVHFDEVSLYGTPVEAAPPGPPDPKQSFLKNHLQALFQPTDNKLAMKLFGSKKALMKERIRQKAAGHWVIHPCSSFR